MNANERLSAWAATVPADHNAMALRRAKTGLLDTIACIVAGYHHDVSQQVYGVASQWGNGASTVVGQSQALAAPWAALSNGTAAHALDFNAYDEPTASHSSATIYSALLAVAEAEGKSGAAVLDAFIVGLEVAMRIGEAINLPHYHLGWHTTATIDTLGAAAGCARLLGLDAAKIATAISIATSRTAGYKSQFGTMTKPLHSGFAAETGVVAAQLAAAGVTASLDTLDGKWSFLTLLSTPDAPGFSAPLAKLGQQLAIEEHGIAIKRYPSCSYTHRPLDAVLSLKHTYKLTPDQIERVLVRIPGREAEILPFVVPQNEAEARFCMPYCVSVALNQGKVGPADFSETAIRREAMVGFIQRVTLQGHPITVQSSDLAVIEPINVAITLKDGRVLEEEVFEAIGMPTRPVSQEDLAEKFADCADGVMAEGQLKQITMMVEQFEAVEDVGVVMSLLKS
ncbi:MAG: MmgE/PrpD family protein [Chloroflexota bacterium]